MQYKEDFDKAAQRLEAFWDREIIDRCCVCVVAPKDGAKRGDGYYGFYDSQRTDADIEKGWLDAEQVLAREIHRMERTYFGGDALPIIFPNLGVAGHAGFFKGARYKMRDTFWFFPSIFDTSRDKLEFDPNSLLYKKIFEIVNFLAMEDNDRYILAMPDYTGDLDALAHLRGSAELMMDMLDDPDWVEASLQTIDKVYLDCMEQMSRITGSANHGYNCIGWLNTLAKGRHSQIQCDISVMLSSDLYRKFTLPEVGRRAAWMDRSLYHFDGIEQLRHLDDLLSVPELGAIQWTSVDGQPSPLANMAALKKIQAAGKCLVLSAFTNEEYDTYLRELSSKGLLILASAADEEEARRKVRTAERLSHE